jgi:diadenosine tetraphosphatase ApaH/serine/threonine PP2A family protein phosphatase
MASPHDLPQQLQRKFKDKWVIAHARLVKLFGCLYNATYVEDQYLMVHGGLPASLRNMQEIAQADNLHPDKPFLEELLWNDPDEAVEGVTPSPRGAGELFGKAITDEVLSRLNAKILIRSHEPAPKGYKINHGGKVLTLFSLKGAPYFNEHCAYLDVPLNKKFEDTNQLSPFIHLF